MAHLTDAEKKKLIELIEKGEPLPAAYKGKLFAPENGTFIQATKEYRLVYDGKVRREEIIANTPQAPFQLVRGFNADNPAPDGWRNMLIYGDNLPALKELYADQRGPNCYKTRDRIKLIYIDQPFATRQDFMKDKEKAYRDKVIGAQFIEFLRKRLILLREILADDGAIYVHLDSKKGHYIKAILDEVFGEHNFINELIWYYRGGGVSKDYFGRKHDTIFLYQKNASPKFNLDAVRIPYSDEILSRPPSSYLKSHRQGNKKIYEGYTLNPLGKSPDDVLEIPIINPEAKERYDAGKFPTQKPERLLERLINAYSEQDQIVLDAFAGSGTTLAVAEKLQRRWIGIDCGRLAILPPRTSPRREGPWVYLRSRPRNLRPRRIFQERRIGVRLDDRSALSPLPLILPLRSAG